MNQHHSLYTDLDRRSNYIIGEMADMAIKRAVDSHSYTERLSNITALSNR